MAQALSQSAFAKLAGISRPAVNKALRRGALVAGSDGLLDPCERRNAHFIDLHQHGFSTNGAAVHPERVVVTEEREPDPSDPSREDLEPLNLQDGMFQNWASVAVDPAPVQQLLDAIQADEQSNPIVALGAMIEAVRSHVADHLRFQAEGLAELRDKVEEVALLRREVQEVRADQKQQADQLLGLYRHIEALVERLAGR